MPPWFFEPKGHYDEQLFESEVLKTNPLGDPHRRPLWVYVPPGYETDAQRRYPSIYVIQGLTGQIDMWRNRPAFRRNFPELADAQFATGGAPPCILIYVDCWTSLGGSQFLGRMTEVRIVPVPPRGVGKDGAAIVFPPLDLDRREAVVRRCRAGPVSQPIGEVFCHVALPS